MVWTTSIYHMTIHYDKVGPMEKRKGGTDFPESIPPYSSWQQFSILMLMASLRISVSREKHHILSNEADCPLLGNHA
jgi:hypothetical protein